MIELRTLRWSFETPDDASAGFTVRMAVDRAARPGEAELLSIPDVLDVRIRRVAPDDRGPQNYPAFPMPDGSVPVLEATLTLHSDEHPDWTHLTIGVPFGLLERPDGPHEVVLHYTGVRWSLFVDGALVDNEFPFGAPRWPENPPPARTATATPVDPPRRVPIAYWTPPGHNAWVGDVVTLFHDGRYHVFYLYDRRHHASKFGQGAHYFEHLSTADLVTWTEHEAATPLDEAWECIGTGLPFVADGKLCLGYGLHTTRLFPEAQTTLPAQWEHLKTHGRTGSFPRGSTPGYPAGSTYSVRGDDGRFHKTWTTFHPCENPSVFTHPDGRLRMLANYRADGIWESDSIDGGWRCVQTGFPPGGDCTFFFRWGAFDYIVGGFTGLWVKPADAPDDAYVSLVERGLDFYDGSNVPSISEVFDGRFVMAAWLPIRGWGGPLLLRELVQLPDGRLGSKWLPEAVPVNGPARPVDATTFPLDTPSALLTFTARPDARLDIAFLGDGNDATFQLRPAEGRAQFGVGAQKSLREGGAPHAVGDYAVENLVGVDGPFAVRVIVWHDQKLGGSLIDVEIAGMRTMITFRPELRVTQIALHADGAPIPDLRLAPLPRQNQP